MRSLISLTLALILGFFTGYIYHKSANPTREQTKLEKEFNKLPLGVKKFMMEFGIEGYKRFQKVKKKI